MCGWCSRRSASCLLGWCRHESCVAQGDLSDSPSHHGGPICALCSRLTHFCVVYNLVHSLSAEGVSRACPMVKQLYLVATSRKKIKDHLRVDDHDLTFLAVWPGRTIQEHGIGVRNDEVECANLLRPILKWDMS